MQTSLYFGFAGLILALKTIPMLGMLIFATLPGEPALAERQHATLQRGVPQNTPEARPPLASLALIQNTTASNH